ncbi:Endoglucanase-7 [Frankliniella fusca]|uniref:Endoglucanase-7 n=1 Tax=Frankliniella fusca TaxID=407009 RepID=A0AAE1I405_9NEOP|nr:Endoglucanase-7 [Frankliniella fusca]
MKFIISLCFLLGFISDYSAAAVLEGRNQGLTEAPQLRSAVRANGDSGQSNMTVAFVPLISIIANLLPRFFGRYSTVTPPVTVQQARSLMAKKTEKANCNEPWHVGKRWENPFNKSLYYQCHYSEKCLHTYKENCYEVKMQECKFPKEFHTEKQQCLYDAITEITYKYPKPKFHNNFVFPTQKPGNY